MSRHGDRRCDPYDPRSDPPELADDVMDAGIVLTGGEHYFVDSMNESGMRRESRCE